jgi:hypothetical protein
MAGYSVPLRRRGIEEAGQIENRPISTEDSGEKPYFASILKTVWMWMVSSSNGKEFFQRTILQLF